MGEDYLKSTPRAKRRPLDFHGSYYTDTFELPGQVEDDVVVQVTGGPVLRGPPLNTQLIPASSEPLFIKYSRGYFWYHEIRASASSAGQQRQPQPENFAQISSYKIVPGSDGVYGGIRNSRLIDVGAELGGPQIARRRRGGLLQSVRRQLLGKRYRLPPVRQPGLR